MTEQGMQEKKKGRDRSNDACDRDNLEGFQAVVIRKIADIVFRAGFEQIVQFQRIVVFRMFQGFFPGHNMLPLPLVRVIDRSMKRDVTKRKPRVNECS